MPAQKQRIIRKLITEGFGKYPTKALPVLIRAQNELRANGLSFTKEETNTIIDILARDMPPASRNMLKNLIK